MTNDLSAKILTIIMDCGSLKRYPSTTEGILPREFCFNGDEINEVTDKEGPSTGFTITCIEEWGGENQGYDYGYVFKFSNGTIEFYLRCVGHYSSWDDTEWLESSIVTPKLRQVTVTDWVNPHDDDPLANCPELLV